MLLVYWITAWLVAVMLLLLLLEGCDGCVRVIKRVRSAPFDALALATLWALIVLAACGLFSPAPSAEAPAPRTTLAP